MKTLTLSLKKQWFDMIKAGIKREEYREIKPHYIRQFIKFETLKNDLIRDYNFHIDFDEGEINGMESELLNLKYDIIEFSLAYPSRAEKDNWLAFKNPKIRIGTFKPMDITQFNIKRPPQSWCYTEVDVL